MGSLAKMGLALALALGALGAGAAASARDSGQVSLSIRVSDDHRDGRYDRGDRSRHERGRNERRYDNDDRHGRYDRGRGFRGGRVVKTRVYDTRFRARIYLVEEIYPGRRGPDRVCTVDVRGPEARYVPRMRVRHIANAECSRHSRIRVV